MDFVFTSIGQMEGDDLDLQLLLSGPANEENLYEVLGGYCTFDSTSSLLRNVDGESAAQEIGPDNEVEDYLEPSMLGCFSAPWTCRQRGSRMRSRLWSVEIGRLFGSQHVCTSRTGKCRTRKNNDHWTKEEIIKLVDGVSKVGIGKWSKLKVLYFSESIRTPVHLKDKWRNLVRACKGKNGSKKKVNGHKATELIVRRFKHRILAIEANKHLGEKRK